MSIRFGMGWAKQLTAILPEPERFPVWQKASRAFGILIIVVTAMNAAAIFANDQRWQSADALQGEPTGSGIVFSQLDAAP
jgi:hypothetical protein